MIEPYLIIGLRRICKALGVGRDTLSRWCREDHFPICVLPDRRFATTKGLVDAWIEGRARASESRPAGQRGHRAVRYPGAAKGAQIAPDSANP